jgi:SPP1 family predicted phage head-tail adaptor
MTNTNEDSLNGRIIIQKRTSTKVKGIPTDTWSDYYSCWCEVLDLIGQEKYDAYNVKLENSLKFKCRTCKLLKDMIFKTKEFRIIWNGITFDVKFIDTLSNSKTDIILQGQAVL